MHDKLGADWDKEKHKEKPSFTRSVLRVFLPQFYSTIILIFFKNISLPVTSLVVGMLVDALESGDEEEYMLYVYFLIIFILLIVPPLSFAQAFFHGVNAGMSVKSV